MNSEESKPDGFSSIVVVTRSQLTGKPCHLTGMSFLMKRFIKLQLPIQMISRTLNDAVHRVAQNLKTQMC